MLWVLGTGQRDQHLLPSAPGICSSHRGFPRHAGAGRPGEPRAPSNSRTQDQSRPSPGEHGSHSPGSASPGQGETHPGSRCPTGDEAVAGGTICCPRGRNTAGQCTRPAPVPTTATVRASPAPCPGWRVGSCSPSAEPHGRGCPKSHSPGHSKLALQQISPLTSRCYPPATACFSKPPPSTVPSPPPAGPKPTEEPLTSRHCGLT